MTVCSVRFSIHAPATPDNCCQLPRGHAGCHVTAVSAPSEPDEHGISYTSSIRWDDGYRYRVVPCASGEPRGFWDEALARAMRIPPADPEGCP